MDIAVKTKEKKVRKVDFSYSLQTVSIRIGKKKLLNKLIQWHVSYLCCSVCRKRTMDPGLLKETGANHSYGMWGNFLHWWRSFCCVVLVFSFDCDWSGVKGVTPPISVKWLTPPNPTPQHKLAVEQDSAALPGSALKTLKSWRFKEHIVLLDRLAGLKGNAAVLFASAVVNPLLRKRFWNLVFTSLLLQVHA